jgi:hypothetical protein
MQIYVRERRPPPRGVWDCLRREFYENWADLGAEKGKLHLLSRVNASSKQCLIYIFGRCAAGHLRRDPRRFRWSNRAQSGWLGRGAIAHTLAPPDNSTIFVLITTSITNISTYITYYVHSLPQGHNIQVTTSSPWWTRIS